MNLNPLFQQICISGYISISERDFQIRWEICVSERSFSISKRDFYFRYSFYLSIWKWFLFQTTERYSLELTFIMFYRFTNFKSSDPFLFLFAFHHFELKFSSLFKSRNYEIHTKNCDEIEKLLISGLFTLLSQYCQGQLTAVLIRPKKLSRLWQYQLFQKFDYEVARFCFQMLRWIPCHFLEFN